MLKLRPYSNIKHLIFTNNITIKNCKYTYSSKTHTNDKINSHPFATDQLDNQSNYSGNQNAGLNISNNYADYSHETHGEHDNDNFFDSKLHPVLYTSLKKKFNPIKYSRKLSKSDRIEENKEIPLFDNINEPSILFNSRQSHFNYNSYLSNKTPVLVPFENSIKETEFNIMDRSEIEARIYNVLRQFDYFGLDKDLIQKFNNDLYADYEKDLGLDSLDWTALLTSIEYEFHTIFIDTFYEHWRCLNDVIKFLEGDEFLF